MLTSLKLSSIFVLIVNSKTLPATVGNSNYRLPLDVVPVHYSIDLRLELDAFNTNIFSGTTSIDLRIVNSITEIKLHGKYIVINNTKLESSRGKINITWEHDLVTDILTIHSEETLNLEETYVLTVAYAGDLSNVLLYGFYESVYDDGEGVDYLASTQFEPTSARQAFPCFDEPAFKATFDIALTFAKNLNALGNTKILNQEDVEGGLQKVTFQTTPKMSTYLVAFVISKFTCQEGTPVDGIPTSLCSRNAAINTTALALSLPPQVFSVMANYTGYTYASSNITKLTQVAIPDFSEGAMENWGLITFRERDLLWDENESSNYYKQLVVVAVTHELSHQWFGDLVTLDWWSNIFLNEGFATYFGYHASDQIYPEWELTRQFVVEQVQVALQSDMFNSLPLSYYVESPTNIATRFDGISYNKGGSILRMVHHFLGLDNFKLGLSDYISANKFSNANPTILWNSFDKYADLLPEPQKLPDKTAVIMESWTFEAGYPLLSVVSNDTNVVISQQQFLLNGTSTTKWYVPISYTLSDESFSETATRAWLIPEADLKINGVLANANWIVLNNQQAGFYRINYDEKLWQKILEALSRPNFDGIDVLNRAQIVDDLLNLARANKKSYPDVLDILKYLENETEYYPWYSALNGFNFVLGRIADQGLKQKLKEYLAKLIANLYISTPFSDENPDDQIYTLKQGIALTWACRLHNQNCIDNAKEQFASYKKGSQAPIQNQRNVVYCSGLIYSDNITEDFNFLWAKYSESQLSTEKETILRAFTCIQDKDVLKMYLERTITEGSGIRRQDAPIIYSSIYTDGFQDINTLLDFLLDNYKKIVNFFQDSGVIIGLISSVADRFTTINQIEQLGNFALEGRLSEDIKSATITALETAVENTDITTRLQSDLNNYFRV